MYNSPLVSATHAPSNTLNTGLLHFPFLLDPCFYAFYTIIAQILYTTNFFIQNIYFYMFHAFLSFDSPTVHKWCTHFLVCIRIRHNHSIVLPMTWAPSKFPFRSIHTNMR